VVGPTIWISSPVRITISIEMERTLTKLQAMINGAFEVIEHSLGSSPMGCSGSVHKLKELVHSKRDIRSGECTVLQCTYQVFVLKGILKRIISIFGELRPCRKWSLGWFGSYQVDTVKEV
jgi:hypothetical protein